MNNIGIGTKFIRQGNKRRDVETVIDIYETFSKASGDRVKRRFVCEHLFLGQRVIDYDVTGTTILRSEIVKFIEEKDDLLHIPTEKTQYHDFCDDEEKMRDFYEMSKKDFLNFYDYLTEEEYDMTATKIKK